MLDLTLNTCCFIRPLSKLDPLVQWLVRAPHAHHLGVHIPHESLPLLSRDEVRHKRHRLECLS